MTVNCAGGYWCSGFRNRTASGIPRVWPDQ
jgi:hypothetical protein